MDLECKLKTAVSKEGIEYVYIAVMLTDTYEKRVFLQGAERELLKTRIQKNPQR